MAFISTIWEGLKLAGEMAWATWWALVLGFTITGAVEAFVSERKMTRLLGDSGLREVGLGTLLGAASSSCSFGAVATAKSLFKKGPLRRPVWGLFSLPAPIWSSNWDWSCGSCWAGNLLLPIFFPV